MNRFLEIRIGNMPETMFLNTVEQNKKTGELTVTDMSPIDFSAVWWNLDSLCRKSYLHGILI